MSKRVGVMIQHPEVWEEFKAYVIRKWGKKHTAMALELEEAIKQYLASQQCTSSGRVHTRTSKKAPKDLEIVKKEILKQVNPGGSLPKNMLQAIIRQSTGIVDRRSVDDRICFLVASGFLKYDWDISPDGKIFRVIGFEANNPR